MEKRIRPPIPDNEKLVELQKKFDIRTNVVEWVTNYYKQYTKMPTREILEKLSKTGEGPSITQLKYAFGDTPITKIQKTLQLNKYRSAGRPKY